MKKEKLSPFFIFLRCARFVLYLPLSSAAMFLVIMFVNHFQSLEVCFILAVAVSYLVLTFLYFVSRKDLIAPVTPVLGCITGIYALFITILLIVTKGNAEGYTVQNWVGLLSLTLPGYYPLGFVWTDIIMVLLPAFPFFAFLLSILFRKQFSALKKAVPLFAALLVCLGVSIGFYVNRPATRHSLRYMHGLSATDFTDYMVYSDPSKLVALDHTVSLSIEGAENMPKMDGDEACYPVYAAVAKEVYQDIAAIEKDALEQKGDSLWSNGEIVRFTNADKAFEQLFNPDSGKYNVDLFFGYKPSNYEIDQVRAAGVALQYSQIARDAFVFFVEPDNPVTDLTSDQIRKIYSGEITNWKEVGGKDQAIKAFQRPYYSESQVFMRKFMDDVPLKGAEWFASFRYDQLDRVVQYANEPGAFGYSFRYFVEELKQENDVRMISVDGVQPTLENIKNGSYPLTTGLYLITRKNDPNPNVQKMIDFMLSPDGQEIVEKTGHAGLGK